MYFLKMYCVYYLSQRNEKCGILVTWLLFTLITKECWSLGHLVTKEGFEQQTTQQIGVHTEQYLSRQN